MYSPGLFLVGVMLAFAESKKSPCWTFNGTSFLEFHTSSRMNISQPVHFELQFKTTESDGVLLYAEGPHDYEALYVKDGKLRYLLTNPAPSGVEGTSGGYYSSQALVNNGSWFQVHMWRNWPRPHAPARWTQDSGLKTGINVRSLDQDGVDRGWGETHVDHLDHHGVVLTSSVYLGGIKDSLVHTKGSKPPQFKGQIKKVHEHGNDASFESYNLNFNAAVKRCPTST